MVEINLDLTYTEVMTLIYAFKRHPVLWDTESPGHRTRSDREDAWTLVATQTGMHKEVCKKKMKSLLSAVRRERTKIQTAKDEGKIEQSKWRYWNDFKFLRGVGDYEEDPLGTAPEMDILDPKTAPDWLKAKVAAKRKAPMNPLPLQANNTDIGQMNSILNEPENTFGAMIALKFKRMYSDQRLYAENLINQITYRGLTGNLTKYCEIETPDLQGGFNITRDSQPPDCDSSTSIPQYLNSVPNISTNLFHQPNGNVETLKLFL